MNLLALGYDNWVASHACGLLQEGQAVARVMAVHRGRFVVRDEQGESPAELSGRFRFDAETSGDLPCVGDWACASRESPDLAIIHAVVPRKTALRRKTPGKTIDFQLMAANVDTAFIVQSCHYDFNIRRLERYIVAVNDGGIEPVIVLSKTDLVSAEELERMITEIQSAGISAEILPLSNPTGNGLEDIRARLVPGETFCLLGSSGVGKSTLINRLLGSDDLQTRSVSDSGEGTHTTTGRQLLVLEGGALLIDTPGMRELGLLGAAEAVELSFSDIGELAAACRFSDCTHTQEPGCAVCAAIESGQLDEDQFQSYLKLKKETEFHNLSYVEKRNKDKNFGKMVKSVMKHQGNK